MVFNSEWGDSLHLTGHCVRVLYLFGENYFQFLSEK